MYDRLIKLLLEHEAKKAFLFVTEKEIVRVVRTSYGNKFMRGNLELTITRGKPNYAERQVVKKMKGKVKGSTFFKYLPAKKKSVR